MDIGVPHGARFTRSFQRVLNIAESPEWRGKVCKFGGHYRERIDLREVSGGELPVILHVENMHNPKAGDKIEIVETGLLSMDDMKSIQREIYHVDPRQNRIMRLDLAADTSGATVQFFRNHTFVKMKQTHREWASQSISSRRSETLYSGVKPCQIRIYDKTGHRLQLLRQERRKMTVEQREVCMSFEERWGYPESKIVTRVERQIGGGEPKKLGFEVVQQLDGLVMGVKTYDPFNQIVFPEDWKKRKPGPVIKSASDRMLADWLGDMVTREGVVNTQNYMYRNCKNRLAYYRLWSKFGAFLQGLADEHLVTREMLLDSFRSSTWKQFNRAA